jgi:ABC-type amino acid transport substrate-binding protein
LIALIALLATVLVAVGCGGDDNKDQSGDLTTITNGKLKVGSDIPYPPFEFGRAPDYEGFDVDLVKQIAKKLDLEAEFVKTPFDTIFRNLAQGKFDMVATASTISAEREKEVDFSDPYFAADQSLMVKKGSDIKTVDDVEGKVVGAQLGTTGADYAKDNTKAKSIRTYDLIDDAFKALEAGQVEAVINDCPVSSYAQKEHESLVVVQAVTTNESYGFAFPSGSDALREAFNKELSQLKDDGTVEELSRKWFGAEPCKLEGAGS